VCFLPHDVDPYIPFSISNASIGVPFTSAVQASLLLNQPSIYYDPSSLYETIYPHNIYPIARGFKQLNDKIISWLEASVEPPEVSRLDFQKEFASNIGL